MRSEREIENKNLERICVSLLSEDESRIKEWLSEGEPHYSVAEIKKIIIAIGATNGLDENHTLNSYIDVKLFLDAFKQKEQIKAVLK